MAHVIFAMTNLSDICIERLKPRMIADDSSKLVNRFKSHLAKCLHLGLSGDAFLIETFIEPWDCDSAECRLWWEGVSGEWGCARRGSSSLINSKTNSWLIYRNLNTQVAHGIGGGWGLTGAWIMQATLRGLLCIVRACACAHLYHFAEQEHIILNDSIQKRRKWVYMQWS